MIKIVIDEQNDSEAFMTALAGMARWGESIEIISTMDNMWVNLWPSEDGQIVYETDDVYESMAEKTIIVHLVEDFC